MQPLLAGAFELEARPLISLVDDLHRLGIDKDVSVPLIAVMGDQSSGKSSVLEAISGIPFPRGTGCVTRCATQVSMSKGESWSAAVSVRRASGKDALPARPVTRFDSPEGLGDEIARVTGELCGEQGFSQDVIEVELTSPDAPDLTLVDLPGIVHTTTEGQSDSVIEDVSNLLDKYLKQPRTIILAVIPCTVDIATVSILERAKKVDPEGHRTLGVLTKCDRVEQANEAQVVEILRNRRKPLKLGYVMVKNRSQEDIDSKMTLREAAEQEKRFFEEHAVYSELEDVQFGTSHLSATLAELLVRHIRRVLPDLIKDVEAKLREAQRHLRALGATPPADSRDQMAKLAEIAQKAGELLAHETTAGSIVKLMLPQLDVFADSVRSTKPDFTGSRDRYSVSSIRYPDKTVSSITVTVSSKLVNFQDASANISKHFEVGDSVQVEFKDGVVYEGTMVSDDPAHSFFNGREVPAVFDCKAGTVTVSQSGPSASSEVSIKPFTFKVSSSSFKITDTGSSFRDEVCRRIIGEQGRELPGFPNFQVFVSFMTEFVGRWREPAGQINQVVLQIVKQVLTGVVERVVPEQFPALRGKMQSSFDAALESAFVGFRTAIREIFDRERTPMTKNHYLMDTVNKIRAERFTKNLGIAFQPGPDGVSRIWDGDAVMAILNTHIQNAQGNASNRSQEAQDMVDLLAAYWKLALKRFTDNAAQVVDQHLVRKLPGLCKQNMLVLIKSDEAMLKSMFATPPSLEKQREECKQRVERLRIAQQSCAQCTAVSKITTAALAPSALLHHALAQPGSGLSLVLDPTEL
jgi:interferon-induced GTP-binding protein Mx1